MTEFGAAIQSLTVPDRNGKPVEVQLGFDSLEGYVKGGGHFGSTVGRYANRIAGGKFTLEGKEYTLAKNNGPNHLHGGPTGFGRQVWKANRSRRPTASAFASPTRARTVRKAIRANSMSK